LSHRGAYEAIDSAMLGAIGKAAGLLDIECLAWRYAWSRRASC